MWHSPRTSLVVLFCVLGWGCGDNGPALPAPTPLDAPSGLQPAPPVTSVPIQPTVTSIAPNVVTTEGEGWATITGTGFESGARVTVGGRVVTSLVERPTGVTFWTVAHAPGPVDVVVINPGGLTSLLAAGLSYAPPGSFDFNGDWEAYAGDDYHTVMSLTIRDGRTVSVACGSSPSVTFTLSDPVTDGRLSVAAEGVVVLSGQLLSPVTATGTIHAAGCPGARWWGTKKVP